MKRFITLIFFAVLLANISCTTQVSKNNQEANGDTKSSASGENTSNLGDANEQSKNKSQTEANSMNNNSQVIDPNSPEGLVEDLYNQNDNENSPFFQNKNRELVNKFFVKNLADMIWKDSVEAKDDIGALDFDPLFNAQDTEISDFKVGKAEINAEKATIIVTFLNFDEVQTIKYILAKENGAWKIEDINFGNDTLVKIYNENKAESSKKK